jgi:uncharacterized protein involved in exopolysaccharide biosynthesis
MNQVQKMIFSVQLTLRRRSCTATITFISVMMGGLIYIICTPRLYQGTAKLVLEPQLDRIVDSQNPEVNSIGYYLRRHDFSLAETAELIKSNKILQLATIQANRLPLHETIDPQKLAAKLTIKAIENQNILEINYQDSNPTLAANIANTIAQITIAQTQQEIHSEIKSFRKFLASEIAKQKQKLDPAQTIAVRNRQNYGLVTINNQNQLIEAKKSNQNHLKLLYGKLEAARIAEVKILNQIKILELAPIPKTFNFPDASLIMAIATFMAVFLSLALILILEALERKYDLHDGDEFN